MIPVQDSQLLVGVDLISVGEMNASIQRFGDRFVRRVFTDREIAYCTRDAHLEGERFAARFAAKEATMKVLRLSDDDAIEWRSIEVRRSPDGWCDLVLHGAAEELANQQGVSGLALSMSHAGEYATATVIGRRK